MVIKIPSKGRYKSKTFPNTKKGQNAAWASMKHARKRKSSFYVLGTLKKGGKKTGSYLHYTRKKKKR